MDTNKFYEQYPLVFPNGRPECGFSCGDGWYDLLDSLFLVITKELEKNPDNKFQIAQIKEKFGKLTIYYDNGNDYIRQTISQAAAMSAQICETCGDYGTLRETTHWLKVRCDKCEVEHLDRKPLSQKAKDDLAAGMASAKDHPGVFVGSFAKYADDE